MSPAEKQNVWFGVAMFLAGLVAGAVLSGFVSFGSGSKAPAAPSAPEAQAADPKDTMMAVANTLGLDKTAFRTCIDGTEFTQKINDEEAAGQKAGVNGTPGNILVDLKTGKARMVSGARPVDSFKAEIDDMLKNPTKPSKDTSVTSVTGFDPINWETEHIRGDKTAKIAIIEYGDYECPFCHRVHPTQQQLFKDYDGKVAWIFRHFPLSFHATAMPLAIGAECAAKLGGNDAFWAYTDAIMSQGN